MLFIRRTWLLALLLLCIFLYVFQRVNTPPTVTVPGGQKVYWTKQEERFPVTSFIPLPSGAPGKIPRIQHEFKSESEAEKRARIQRRDAVKESFLHAWNGYKKHAWGKDEVKPLSGGFVNTFGGWGATLVDTMDTLWIMGLKDEFKQCVKFVEKMDFTTNDDQLMNVFETTIRYLGGLLAAHDLSNGEYPILLTKAKELGELLYSSFDTPNRMPVTRWDWQKSAVGSPIEGAEATLIAELGSLSLEFTRLSQLTGDPKYFDATQRISDLLEANQMKTKIPGLWPIVMNAKSLKFDFNLFTFGGMADSVFEYLPKQHLLLAGRTNQNQKMYEAVIEAAKKYLFFRPIVSTNQDILISGNAKADDDGKPVLDPQGQHLTCFAGGMVGLAAKVFSKPEDMKIARKLTEGCVWAYQASPSKMMPELFHAVPCHVGVEPSDPSIDCRWNEKKWQDATLIYYHKSTEDQETAAPAIIKDQGLSPGFSEIGDGRYGLRPEAIESLFIMYRLTGDPWFSEAAWNMYSTVDAATRTAIGHACIHDVRKNITDPDWVDNLNDRMESFWLAETLKYAYLVFEEPEVVDLGSWVLNTEAHPLKLELS